MSRAFVSYSHADNIDGTQEDLLPDQVSKGWVYHFTALLAQELAPRLANANDCIWWDKFLRGSAKISDINVEELRQALALVCVLSPSFVESPYCREEIATFARNQQAAVVEVSRCALKVIKHEVAQEKQPPEIRGLKGHAFYKKNGSYEQLLRPKDTEFLQAVERLAQDLFELLRPEEVNGPRVYVATTTSDLAELRLDLCRELKIGHRVLPASELYGPSADIVRQIDRDLIDVQLSIHMLGRPYGAIPEGGQCSLSEMQLERVRKAREGRAFPTLVWLPPNLTTEDARQHAFLNELRARPNGVQLLQGDIQGLKELAGRAIAPPPAEIVRRVPGARARVYVMWDIIDEALAKRVLDVLDGVVDVQFPLFDAEPAESRQEQARALAEVEGVVMVWGQARDLWHRQQVREVEGAGPRRASLFGGKCSVFGAPFDAIPKRASLPGWRRLREDQSEFADALSAWAREL